MHNIVLVCQHGASTGMLVEKMMKAANEKGIEIVINAYPDSKLDTVIADADIVLLAPQVRFKKTTFENKYQNLNLDFIVIDTIDYGMLNGAKVLNQVLTRLEGK